MWRSISYNKKTKKGKVLKVIQEHYLRDNLSCNSSICEVCPPAEVGTILLSPQPFEMRYCIPDTNAILHQMDLIEKQNPLFVDFIILQTVLAEVRHNSLSLFNRLIAMIKDPNKRFTVFPNEHLRDTYIDQLPEESSNDYNDRAIRVAALYFDKHFSRYDIHVWLLTDDRANAQKAKSEGLTTYTIKEYIDHYIDQFPDLQDFYTSLNKEIQTTSTTSSTMTAMEKYKPHIVEGHIYPSYLSQEMMEEGVKKGELFVGTYRSNRNYWKEGSVTYYTKSGEENKVFIKGLVDINRAVDGDRVCIYVYPKDQWQAPSEMIEGNEAETETVKEETSKSSKNTLISGRVVGIIKRNWTSYCGSIEIKEGYTYIPGTSVFFIPVNRQIPKIRFKTRQYNEIVDKRIIVAIDDWTSDSVYPIGHYQSTIGLIGDKEVETQVILLEHSIPFQPFTKEVMDCLPPENWKITPENSKGRVDLRDRCVCSIDPPGISFLSMLHNGLGCKDIDDALHARQLSNGNYEIGVHIADVAYYIRSGSPLDKEAANRSTSTYLVNRRLDMLPKVLTEKLCSLVGGEERFAFSCVWEMDKNANIIKVDFFRSIIRSRKAMTYGEAQSILDDPNSTGEIADSLRILLPISKILKENRNKKGALNLASPEVHFHIDSETSEPLNMEEYEHKDTHSLVEEFMLLANCSVAKRITDVYRNIAVLRRHPVPSQERFANLIKVAKQAGFDFDTSSSLALEQSLEKAVDPKDPYFNKLIRILTTRCMTQAVYFPAGEQSEENFMHYGLAAPIYTHFTSPIRRYADVMVHRLLAAAQNLAPLPEEYMDKQYMHNTCENMNTRHYNAQMAGRDSVQLYTYIFFNKRREESVGICMQCCKNGIVVWIPKFGLEGYVMFTKNHENPLMNIDDYVFDENELTMKNTRKNQELRTFKPVKVLIYVKEKANYRKELVIELLDIDVYDKKENIEGDSQGEIANEVVDGKRVLEDQDQSKKQKKSA